jgi:hypothetical protein
MGQKVNPHGLRVGVIKDWDSRWYAREDKVGDLIVEDHKIREYLKKTLYSPAFLRSRSSETTQRSRSTSTAHVPVSSSARAALRSRSSVRIWKRESASRRSLHR